MEYIISDCFIHNFYFVLHISSIFSRWNWRKLLVKVIIWTFSWNVWRYREPPWNNICLLYNLLPLSRNIWISLLLHRWFVRRKLLFSLKKLLKKIEIKIYFYFKCQTYICYFLRNVDFVENIVRTIILDWITIIKEMETDANNSIIYLIRLFKHTRFCIKCFGCNSPLSIT